MFYEYKNLFRIIFVRHRLISLFDWFAKVSGMIIIINRVDLLCTYRSSIHIERPNRAIQKFPISCGGRVGNLVEATHISSEQMEEPVRLRQQLRPNFSSRASRREIEVGGGGETWLINYLPTRKTVW